VEGDYEENLISKSSFNHHHGLLWEKIHSIEDRLREAKQRGQNLFGFFGTWCLGASVNNTNMENWGEEFYIIQEIEGGLIIIINGYLVHPPTVKEDVDGVLLK
ncbi:unnamed protein product, partial [Owenia fusiformis]